MDQPSSAESNAITLRIKFKSASLDEFINRYGVDVSPGGIFIRTKQPVDVGTSLQFDFTLADGSPLLAGLGTVAWVRESDPARANNVPGMGLRFDKLTPESQHTHQLILSEKSRKEGKALSTPYPPTSFVSPGSVSPAPKLSPSPDAMRTATEIAAKMEAAGPVNLATTRPTPAAAAKPLPVAASAPTASVDGSEDDTNEFESSGKTEISEKPLDYYLKEAAREAEAAHVDIRHTAEDAVPNTLLEDFNTDSQSLPSTKSGPPPAEYDVKDPAPTAAAEAKAPAKPLSGERKSGTRQAFASLLDLGESNDVASLDLAAPAEVLEEISAGAPLEETPSEKTEEVSLAPAAPLPMSIPAPEPFDLGGAPLDGDRPSKRDSALLPKRKGSGKLIAGIAVLAAAAAFGAVYLAQTKPWQQAAAPELPKVAVATPAPAPAQAKPAVVEEAVAKKPVAEEAKPVVAAAAKVEPEKPAAEKPAEKPTAEKPAAEKPAGEKAAVAKAESEVSAAKPTTKSGVKAGGKAGGEEKWTMGEEAYRLLFKSTPISAEVLIDGEYFGRTPCDRRILDPKKTYVITIRREGYEPHERLLGASDNWVKKGNERTLTITANLKKLSAQAAGTGLGVAPGGSEAKAAKTPEAVKPETKPAPPEAAKPEAAKPEAAKPEAAKPEAAKPAAAKPEAVKPEAAKPAPAEKSTVFKPVPNFDESGKAKE